MKTENRPENSYKTVYIANDGQEFTSEQECRKYEDTATCAIRAMFNTLPMKVTSCDNADNNLSGEDSFVIMHPKNADELIVINRFLQLYGGPLVPVGAIGEGIVIYINYDGEYYYDGTVEYKIKQYTEALTFKQ